MLTGFVHRLDISRLSAGQKQGGTHASIVAFAGWCSGVVARRMRGGYNAAAQAALKPCADLLSPAFHFSPE
jgi:hypothetical protein